MFIIYTKEKKPKIVATVNLTSEELERMGVDEFVNCPNVKKENHIVIEKEKEFENPILDNGKIREMTRAEKVENDIEIYLNEGEIIQDKKIIVIPRPTNLYQPIWNGKEWEEGSNKIDLLKEKSEKVLKLRKIKIEINTLKEIAEIDEELADEEMIELYQNEYDLLKKEILALSKVIKSL